MKSSQGCKFGGRVISYKPGKPLTFNAGKWHASVEGSGQQLLLLGYTPRSLHKLSDNNRKQLLGVRLYVPSSYAARVLDLGC